MINTFLNMWNKTKGPKGQYLFIHVPKTGGTTFRHVIYKNFNAKYIYPTTEQLFENGGGYLSQQSITPLIPSFPQDFIIMGHYNYTFKNKLHADTKTIVFLRNPIERTKSHIRHLGLYNTQLKNKTISQILNLKISALSNHQAKVLGYNPKLENFEQALNNLENCTCVGISEFFQKSINKINKNLMWNLSYAEHDKKNKTPKSSLNLTFSPQEIELIRKYNQVDMKLYEHALLLFNS